MKGNCFVHKPSIAYIEYNVGIDSGLTNIHTIQPVTCGMCTSAQWN